MKCILRLDLMTELSTGYSAKSVWNAPDYPRAHFLKHLGTNGLKKAINKYAQNYELFVSNFPLEKSGTASTRAAVETMKDDVRIYRDPP